MNSNFDNFKLVAKPRFGTVSGNALQARVAVRNKTTFKLVAALAEQHGGTVAADTGRYPQLVLIKFEEVNLDKARCFDCDDYADGICPVCEASTD